MAVLIDASILIEAERGRLDLGPHVARHGDEKSFLSVITIGPHDLWLAATCLAHGLTMVTANVRELDRVPGLVVELWADAPRPRDR